MKKSAGAGAVLLAAILAGAPGGAAQEWRTFVTSVPADGKHTVGFISSDGQQPLPALRASTVVETKITPGRPYSAEATTEFNQTLSDGNRIVRKTTVRIFRDGDGRTRREELAADGTVRSVSIYDPVAHVTYVLDPATKTARKSSVRIAMPSMAALTDDEKRKVGTKVAGEPVAVRGGTVELVAPVAIATPAQHEEARKRTVETVVAAGGGRGGGYQAGVRVDQAKEEALGQKMVEGVLAEGKRVTTTLPAGTIGNQQPIVAINEQWFSAELEILVMTRHSDPRSGETSYAVTSIVRGEPDAGLFDVPADYQIVGSSYLRYPAER